MSEALIASVIAARHAAEAAHSNADGSPRTEAQQAAILLAQVEAILAARPAPAAVAIAEVAPPEGAPTPAAQPAPEPVTEPTTEPASAPDEENNV